MFRILVAEDDKGTRRLMQDTLADAGYEPLPAADGQQALELLGQKHVDLMVLDVMMPKLDGFSLLSQLRSTGSDLPVLVLTAKEAQADKRRGLRLGADDYMTKPAVCCASGRCCAGRRPSAAGSWRWAAPCWSTTTWRCAGTDAPPCCPARSSSFCTSCCPAPARPLPAAS